MSVKWCAVEHKGHSEALRWGSSYPGGLIRGTGLATWGPRRLVGPLIYTCQRERCTTQSASQGYSDVYTQYIYILCICLTRRHNEEVVNSWITMTKTILLIKYTHLCSDPVIEFNSVFSVLNIWYGQSYTWDKDVFSCYLTRDKELKMLVFLYKIFLNNDSISEIISRLTLEN